MKVILINPPSPYLANDAAYPPSGLMYVATVIEKIGCNVEIVDLAGGIDWRKKTHELNADLFGITCVTPNFKIVKEIADLLPADRPVIVGGVHPTFLPDDTLKNIRCNAIVKGEAELAIITLINDLKKGDLKKIYEGGLVTVENIPKPSRHLVDLHKYRPGGEDTTPIYSSRGCPFNCNFCSKVTGRTYRVIPVQQVVEEIEDVIKLSFHNIVFGDDDIAIQPKRVKELMTAIMDMGLKFRLNQDARIIDEEAIDLARRAGCQEISFGIETGSQRMLDLMNKRTTVDANKKAILVTKEHGLKAKAYFLVNFPGEDIKSVEETLKFAEEVKPDKWLLSSFAPLPGSDTFCNPDKYGIIWMSKNWEDYYLVGKDGSFKPCFETAELSIERQIHLHSILYKGLKEILG
jgi:radical SAM superfamily enzyme YgiQ (UPF0313 family)